MNNILSYSNNLKIDIIKILLVLSALFILISVITSISNANFLDKFCICKINYLAYSWISFGVSVLFSCIIWYVYTVKIQLNQKAIYLLNIITFIDILLFIVGIVFLLIFTTLILDII